MGFGRRNQHHVLSTKERKRFLESLEGKGNHVKKLGGGMMNFKQPLELSGLVRMFGKRLGMRKI